MVGRLRRPWDNKACPNPKTDRCQVGSPTANGRPDFGGPKWAEVAGNTNRNLRPG